MKVTYRIPTEQYAYVEVEQDMGTTEIKAIREDYENLKAAFAAKAENVADDKFVTDYIYKAINGEGNSPEDWEKLHPLQQRTLKCYKNALARKKPN